MGTPFSSNDVSVFWILLHAMWAWWLYSTCNVCMIVPRAIFDSSGPPTVRVQLDNVSIHPGNQSSESESGRLPLIRDSKSLTVSVLLLSLFTHGSHHHYTAVATITLVKKIRIMTRIKYAEVIWQLASTKFFLTLWWSYISVDVWCVQMDVSLSGLVWAEVEWWVSLFEKTKPCMFICRL